jgi:hypothetical protein
MDVENLESCSLLSLLASATTPGRHFAAGRVANFVEGGIECIASGCAGTAGCATSTSYSTFHSS